MLEKISVRSQQDLATRSNDGERVKKHARVLTKTYSSCSNVSHCNSSRIVTGESKWEAVRRHFVRVFLGDLYLMGIVRPSDASEEHRVIGHHAYLLDLGHAAKDVLDEGSVPVVCCCEGYDNGSHVGGAKRECEAFELLKAAKGLSEIRFHNLL